MAEENPKLTDEQAEAMLKALSRHFRTPVMPIDRYCEALNTWQTVIGERATRLMEELYPGIHGEYYEDPSLKPAAEKAVADYQADEKLGNRHGLAHREGREMTQRDYAIESLREYESRSATVGNVFTQIRKSNLLARLLYAGEKLRTKICPEHKGKWSGIEWSGTVCPHKCQLTGWIQEEADTGKPLPGVVAVQMVQTGNSEEEVMIVRSVTGEVMGKAKVTELGGKKDPHE